MKITIQVEMLNEQEDIVDIYRATSNSFEGAEMELGAIERKVKKEAEKEMNIL